MVLYFTLRVVLVFVGGKKKPLKAPKKESKEVDEVIMYYTPSWWLCGSLWFFSVVGRCRLQSQAKGTAEGSPRGSQKGRGKGTSLYALLNCLIDWLIDWLVDWLIDYFDWLLRLVEAILDWLIWICVLFDLYCNYRLCFCSKYLVFLAAGGGIKKSGKKWN